MMSYRKNRTSMSMTSSTVRGLFSVQQLSRATVACCVWCASVFGAVLPGTTNTAPANNVQFDTIYALALELDAEAIQKRYAAKAKITALQPRDMAIVRALLAHKDITPEVKGKAFCAMLCCLNDVDLVVNLDELLDAYGTVDPRCDFLADEFDRLIRRDPVRYRSLFAAVTSCMYSATGRPIVGGMLVMRMDPSFVLSSFRQAVVDMVNGSTDTPFSSHPLWPSYLDRMLMCDHSAKALAALGKDLQQVPEIGKRSVERRRIDPLLYNEMKTEAAACARMTAEREKGLEEYKAYRISLFGTGTSLFPPAKDLDDVLGIMTNRSRELYHYEARMVLDAVTAANAGMINSAIIHYYSVLPENNHVTRGVLLEGYVRTMNIMNEAFVDAVKAAFARDTLAIDRLRAMLGKKMSADQFVTAMSMLVPDRERRITAVFPVSILVDGARLGDREACKLLATAYLSGQLSPEERRLVTGCLGETVRVSQTLSDIASSGLAEIAQFEKGTAPASAEAMHDRMSAGNASLILMRNLASVYLVQGVPLNEKVLDLLIRYHAFRSTKGISDYDKNALPITHVRSLIYTEAASRSIPDTYGVREKLAQVLGANKDLTAALFSNIYSKNKNSERIRELLLLLKKHQGISELSFGGKVDKEQFTIVFRLDDEDRLTVSKEGK
ncbi:MAG: hypothetical protein AABZ39_03870 [Spirochaetota bacterium]